MKPKSFNGKLNHIEDKCPHCGAVDEYSDVAKNIMELSAQHYKKCIKCQGDFVDTYLIDFADEDDLEAWELSKDWENDQLDQALIFDEMLFGDNLIYDEDNPDQDSDYYDIQPRSIHFIKDED